MTTKAKMEKVENYIKGWGDVWVSQAVIVQRTGLSVDVLGELCREGKIEQKGDCYRHIENSTSSHIDK